MRATSSSTCSGRKSAPSTTSRRSGRSRAATASTPARPDRPVKLAVIAIGRPGRGPEATLAADYAERATLAGRALGLGPLELIDLEARKPGKAAEAELILKAAEGAHLIACDERGKTFSSRAFADHIAMLRDRGERRLAFAIGGTSGERGGGDA